MGLLLRLTMTTSILGEVDVALGLTSVPNGSDEVLGAVHVAVVGVPSRRILGA